ncbi:TPA: hypothetical protein U1C81_000695 [Streptococcus suis]|nr:hypothetical protein [Streptococcus suis]
MILLLGMTILAFTAIYYGRKFENQLRSEQYRQQVCLEVLKEQRRKEGFS